MDLFKSNISDKEHLAVINALVLGYKDELSNSTKLSFSSTGAMHVLAVSGLHVGISSIYFMGFLVIHFLLKKPNIEKCIGLTRNLVYAMITHESIGQEQLQCLRFYCC